jgi:Reverse transcriptase (RNA-dependent DNA polymerase)
MTIPLDHKKVNDYNLIRKLKKYIYGLKQSSWTLYEKLSSYLISYNFKISNADHLVFSERSNEFIIIVIIYVDDIIIIAIT